MDSTVPKRAKVKLEFPEKLFYEKVLIEWKSTVLNKNYAYTIKKAMDNLKRFPLDVSGYAELKKIRGIGEDIASKLDAAWKNATENYFEGTPSLEQVKRLSNAEAYGLLESASFVQNGKKTALNPKPSKKNENQHAKAIPVDNQKNLPKAKSQNQENNTRFGTFLSQPQLFSSVQQNELLIHEETGIEYASTLTEFLMSEKATTSTSMASTSTNKGQNEMYAVPSSSYPSQSSVSNANGSTSSASSQQNPQHSSTSCDNLTCDPEVFKALGLNVTLVVDEREKNVGSRSGLKTMGEHLSSLNVQFETRVLSVGDYLWIVKIPGTGELVLDYVIERKTWDDLKRSIRDVRYQDQKQRLIDSGIKNVILVVEGKDNSDTSLEQAMITSSVHNEFLVHRTQNIQGTAKLLKYLTARLEKRCNEEILVGPSFQSLQSVSKKVHALTVQDCWLQQLTVCPGMSVEKAKIVAERFPSFRTLAMFYKANWSHNEQLDEGILRRELPQIPMSVSKYLYRFIKEAKTGQ